MTRIKGTLDEFLLGVRLAIINTTNDPIMSGMMASYGYCAEKMNAAKTLYDETLALINMQMKKCGEQFETNDELDRAYHEANEAYMKSLKLSRVALEGKEKVHMMIDGPRKTSLSGWIKQAEAFYDNLKDNHEMLAEMAKFGRTSEMLRAESKLVKKVADYHQKQRKESSEAHVEAKLMDEKLDELGKWLSDFRAVAEIAFWNNPQRMEAIGVFAQNAPKRKEGRRA